MAKSYFDDKWDYNLEIQEDYSSPLDWLPSLDDGALLRDDDDDDGVPRDDVIDPCDDFIDHCDDVMDPFITVDDMLCDPGLDNITLIQQAELTVMAQTQDPPEPISEDDIQLVHKQPAPCNTPESPENASQDEARVANAAQAGPSHKVQYRPWPVVPPGKSIGVTFREENKTWESHIWRKDVNINRANKSKKGSQQFLGSYYTEEDAKMVHDLAAIIWDIRVNKHGTLYSLNYPEEHLAGFFAEHRGMTDEEMLKVMKRRGKFSKGECKLKGVRRKKSGPPGWFTATISLTSDIDGVQKKTSMTLGHFQSEVEAGRQYDRALLFIKGTHDLGCVPNFPTASYSQTEIDAMGRTLAANYPKINFNNLKRKRSKL